jgi:hypothetical protein
MPSGVGHAVAVRVAEVASCTRACSTSRSEHEWAKVLRLSTTSPRRPLHAQQSLQAEGTGRRGLQPASEWRAHGGDSSQEPCLGMVVHGNVAVTSYRGVHAVDGAGGLRRDEEELGGAGDNGGCGMGPMSRSGRHAPKRRVWAVRGGRQPEWLIGSSLSQHRAGIGAGGRWPEQRRRGGLGIFPDTRAWPQREVEADRWAAMARDAGRVQFNGSGPLELRNGFLILDKGFPLLQNRK